MENANPMRSMIFKLGFIGAMILAFLIPIEMIKSIADERESRKKQVLFKMQSIWGKKNQVGPIFWTVPGKEKNLRRKPEQVKIIGSIHADIRKKGIFKIPLYEAQLTISGNFQLENKKKEIRHSFLDIGFLDPYAVELQELQINNKVLAIEKDGKANNRIAIILKEMTGSFSFMLRCKVKGMQSLDFLPSANFTTVELKSNWPDPNFKGAFLPTSRKIDAKGFSAVWQVRSQNNVGSLKNIGKQWAFGVGLFLPVDVYQQTTRVIKYAILFIFLTFLTFFLIEIMNPIRIHPMQYTLVGFALCLFYLLLLSLSEHIPFALSYWIATSGIVGMITMYSINALQNKKRAFGMGGLLTGLYLFLFILLQMEEYSLLMGTLALFIILALVMYFTRDIDWYEIFGESAIGDNKNSNREEAGD